MIDFPNHANVTLFPVRLVLPVSGIDDDGEGRDLYMTRDIELPFAPLMCVNTSPGAFSNSKRRL